MLRALASRMQCGNFPHEIGVFLGYYIQAALRGGACCNLSGDPFGQMDIENCRVLHRHGAAAVLYCIPCRFADLVMNMDELLRLLKDGNTRTIEQLAAELHTADADIRRQLEFLEHIGAIRRISA